MLSALQRRLPDGTPIGRLLIEPVLARDEVISVVDVGARNGTHFLPPAYAAHARLVGFEPNPEEFEKLQSDNTNARQVGIIEPPFASKKYHPVALWSERCDRTLYLTNGPGAVSLMGEAHREMTENMFRDTDPHTYYDRCQVIEGTAEVPCDTLDNVWGDETESVDLLKIDVEGAELRVLEGARGLLEAGRILMIKTEFLWTPYYAEHATLGHQQVLLDGLGYRLISLDSAHSLYSWGRTEIPKSVDRRLTYAGDAYFIVDPDLKSLSESDRYRLGLAALAMGFSSLGLNLIRVSNALPGALLDRIETELARVSLTRRAKLLWDRFPHWCASHIKR